MAQGRGWPKAPSPIFYFHGKLFFEYIRYVFSICSKYNQHVYSKFIPDIWQNIFVLIYICHM